MVGGRVPVPQHSLRLAAIPCAIRSSTRIAAGRPNSQEDRRWNARLLMISTRNCSILFDAYVHGALDRRGFLDKAAKYAVGGVTAAMLLDQLSPKFLAGAGRQAGGPAHQGAAGRIRLAEGLRQDARLPGAAGQGRGQAAGRARHSREPRVEPAHRGHRPPAGARQLRRVRAGRAVPARRISG